MRAPPAPVLERADLPASARALLELAACLGERVPEPQLRLASKLSSGDLEQQLEPALLAGLVLRAEPRRSRGEAAQRGWRFASNELWRAVLLGMKEERRQRLRRRVVRRLRRAWREQGQESLLFAAAEQLCSLEAADEPARTRTARMELLVEAAQRAAASQEWERAQRYLGAIQPDGAAHPPQRTGATDPPAELGAQLDAARDATLQASEGVNPGRLAARMLERVVGFCGAQRAAFFLEQEGTLCHLASTDRGWTPQSQRAPLEPGGPWPVALLGEVLSLSRPASDESPPPGVGDQGEGLAGSWWCLPLCAAAPERPAGVLLLAHPRQGALGSLDHHALGALAEASLEALAELGAYEDLARFSRALEHSSSKLAHHSANLQAEVAEWAGDLEALHEEHRSTLEALLDGVLRLDLQGRVLYANPATARLTGYSAAELEGAPAAELLDPRDGAGEALQPAWPGQLPHRDSDASLTALLRRKDGERVSVELRWSRVFGPDGEVEGGVIAIRDNTARQRLEQQLRQSQKMEAMGRFAGGMAHDLNNLLVPILGHLERIGAHASGETELLRRVTAASSAAERASSLVKQVLAFSRRAEVFKQPHDLLPIVDDVCRFLARSTDRSIRLVWEPPEGSFWFMGDASLVQQVLLNLGLNARHALEEAAFAGGGPPEPCIRVELSRMTRAAAADRLPDGAPDPSLVLCVRDNGVGMDARTMARIFEPFFTTKPADRGTGLGLSVVYGIIEQHEGLVTVSSQPGRGACFTCYLPACEPQVRAVAEQPAAEPRMDQGRTILVVDDEDLVRELAREVLEEFGYRVIEAPDGETALELHAELGDDLDLVLLDLSMPGISGPATLERLLARAPRLPVVLWSGYSAEDDLPASVGAGARAFLEKPFELGKLVLTVQRVLEDR